MVNRLEPPCAVCLSKGNERYIWLFTDETRDDALRVIGTWAADPSLSLTWYDAAYAAREVRKA